jgi:muconolactone delta-isomerase
MKFLALEKAVPGAAEAAFTDELLREEALRAWELYRQGLIRELYFRADASSAVLVLECNTPSLAQDTLASLPLVQRGLIAFEVIPLRPYPGFSRLFASPATGAGKE